MRSALTSVFQSLLAVALGQGLILLMLGAGCSPPEVVPSDFPTFDQVNPPTDSVLPDTSEPDQGDGGTDGGDGPVPGDGGDVGVPDGEPPPDGRASCYAVNKTGDCAACATPRTDEQFLNQCTATSCQPFDNATRLPLLKPGGGVPPLP
jgi:hypothetical protein